MAKNAESGEGRMKKENLLIISDEQTIKDLKYILNSKHTETKNALKMNIYSYLQLVLGKEEEVERQAQERRDNFTIINGGLIS